MLLTYDNVCYMDPECIQKPEYIFEPTRLLLIFLIEVE